MSISTLFWIVLLSVSGMSIGYTIGYARGWTRGWVSFERQYWQHRDRRD